MKVYCPAPRRFDATQPGGIVIVRAIELRAKTMLAAGIVAVLGLTLTTAPDTSAATAECGGAAVPSGFVIENGKPHATKAPYANLTLYNPQSLSNFIGLSLMDSRNSLTQQTCLGRLGADTLLAGASTRSYTDAGGLFARRAPVPVSVPVQCQPLDADAPARLAVRPGAGQRHGRPRAVLRQDA